MSTNGTVNGTGNGATVSPYVRLAAVEAAFTTVQTELETILGQKFYEAQKAEIEAQLAESKLLRHKMVALIAGRLGAYEAKQAAKLSSKTA